MKKIENAQCIFLMGGTTREQIKYINENNFAPAIRNNSGTIIGMSAGAINLGIKSLSLKHSGEDRTVIYSGMGLTDKTVFPHFTLTETKVISELMNYSKDFMIYGICDNSAIIERNGKTIVTGDVYRLHEGKMEKMK